MSQDFFIIYGGNPACVPVPQNKLYIRVGVLWWASSGCSIRLRGPDGTNGALAEVEPGQAIDGLRAEVTCNGEPATKDVVLTVKADDNTGGHNHVVNRPPGTLTPTSGSSPLSFSFAAPAPAGDHTITAKCADDSCGTDSGRVWVGVKGLQPIGNSPWELVGGKSQHPSNHYLTPQAYLVLRQFAIQWRRLYVPFGPVFAVNDASLERGGLFDCCETYVDSRGNVHDRNIEGWWTPPHTEHRRGTVVDIRANGGDGSIRSEDEGDFVEYAERLGADAEIHSAGVGRHFHVRLLGVAE